MKDEEHEIVTASYPLHSKDNNAKQNGPWSNIKNCYLHLQL